MSQENCPSEKRLDNSSHTEERDRTIISDVCLKQNFPIPTLFMTLALSHNPKNEPASEGRRVGERINSGKRERENDETNNYNYNYNYNKYTTTELLFNYLF